ncbi:MAG: hypothetical protein ACI39U_01105 [Candidatus Cryptobacteroides sp.]
MKRLAYILAAVAMMMAAVSCLQDKGYADTMPYPSEDCYLMTIANDSNVKTVWILPEKGDAENPGALPAEKPVPDENSLGCFPLDVKKSREIWINDKVTHPTQTYGPDDAVPFYVFEATLFESTDWADILADPLKYRKFSLTVEELVEAGRKVVYKGN